MTRAHVMSGVGTVSGRASVTASPFAVPARPRAASVEDLTRREREVLAAMAMGLSNLAIARELFISERTVESLCASMFLKLGLHPSCDRNRRVQAVLAYLGR